MICVLKYNIGTIARPKRLGTYGTYLTARRCKNSICQCQGNKICNMSIRRYTRRSSPPPFFFGDWREHDKNV